MERSVTLTDADAYELQTVRDFVGENWDLFTDYRVDMSGDVPSEDVFEAMFTKLTGNS